MLGRVLRALLLLTGAASLVGTATPTRTLTFEDRVRAQEAIERVYYSHQIGATKPFEEAVPRAALERKVHTYLKQSAALELYWKAPITSAALRSELERLARETHMPERFMQVYEALGHDPFLFQECFVRQVLAERLSRNFFTRDRRIHRDSLREAEGIREDLLSGKLGIDSPQFRRHVSQPELDSDASQEWRSSLPANVDEIGPLREDSDTFSIHVVLSERDSQARSASYVVPKVPWDSWWKTVEDVYDGSAVVAVADNLPVPSTTTLLTPTPCTNLDTWSEPPNMSASPSKRSNHSAVWTGNEMIIWGGIDGSIRLNTGRRYNPLTDTWTIMSVVKAPSARERHLAVWTGGLMIVWGGAGGNAINSGGRYDPVTDTWEPTTLTGAPSPRYQFSMVWTGAEMIIWGGQAENWTYFSDGAAYNPVSDQWTPLSFNGAPVARSEHTAVWTGQKMLVWGGGDRNGSQPIGGVYDRTTDNWQPMSTSNAPVPRSYHTAVWSGSRMIVWGGFQTGGSYDPVTDSWSALSSINQAPGYIGHASVWTGSAMAVWGGYGSGFLQNTGALYDPSTDAWTPIDSGNAPESREDHTMIWTGSMLIVWGGQAAYDALSSGGRYSISASSWTPVSESGLFAPPGASYTSVWTGNVMILWGGQTQDSILDTGSRYDPLTGGWLRTANVNKPSRRYGHTAIWTGGEMIVWGGADERGNLDTGRRYDPVTDTWRGMQWDNRPSARHDHTAVWSKREMLIWGGWGGGNTGAAYDPTSDSWRPITTIGAPSGRAGHAAVWTGREMIIWCGWSPLLNTGGRYDPLSDHWVATTTLDAPPPRGYHGAVWTGRKMIVWGGFHDLGERTNTGGQYDPLTDSWSNTSLTNAPSPRAGPAMVWAGSRMIVWGGSGDTTGSGGPVYEGSGATYDPNTDDWAVMSLVDAPSARSNPAAVWTGSDVLVVGGYSSNGYLRDMSHYLVDLSEDADQDGHRVCSGDCDDTNPSVFPLAPAQCDGLNNDCLDVLWPGITDTNEDDSDSDDFSECAGDCNDADPTVFPHAPEACDGVNKDCSDPAWPQIPADEQDQDLDGFRICQGDCDDIRASVRPGGPQICGDGLNNDCSSQTWPTPPSDESDADSDGFRICQGDCDDSRATVRPGGVQVCEDGLNNDCSHALWPSTVGTNESDDDADGVNECQGDCDDLVTSTHPGAPEVNDGKDNECPGEPGYGITDELSDDIGFNDRDNPALLCWPPQPAATRYGVIRNVDPRFIAGCTREQTNSSCMEDGGTPPVGAIYYYLVRSELPWTGSWGRDSAGAERTGLCPAAASTFTFVDTNGDDVTATSLRDFFQSMSPSTNDYIFFEVTGSPTGGAWCSERADFYRDSYLSLASGGATPTSGSWNKWHRNGTAPWSLPTTSGFPNYYGTDCYEPWSWCSEYGLGNLLLDIRPAGPNFCEITDDNTGCNAGTWRLTIRISPDRLSACGF